MGTTTDSPLKTSTKATTISGHNKKTLWAQQDKPILFQGIHIPKIYKGLKTVTRRIIRPQPDGFCSHGFINEKERWATFGDNTDKVFSTRYGVPGDILWVKETWFPVNEYIGTDPGTAALAQGCFFRADLPDLEHENGDPIKWKSSLFLSKKLSRLKLLVKSVGIEPIHHITEDQALKDGGWEYKNCPYHKDPIKSFRILWDSMHKAPKPYYRKINGKRILTHYESYPWDTPFMENDQLSRIHKGHPHRIFGNPWIWKVEFEVKT